MKVTQLHKNFISNILALIANVVVGILYLNSATLL